MKKLTLFAAMTLWSLAGFSTVHTIINVGFTFSPTPITINEGDSVHFALESIHTAVEVSQATWNANGIDPLPGGFNLPLGGGMVFPDKLTVGTHWYVCSVHVQFTGMKGIIIVSPGTGISDIKPHLDLSVYPNPANDQITIKSANDLIGSQYYISDAAGRLVVTGIINDQTFTVNIDQLKPGVYSLEVADRIKQSLKLIKK